MAALLVMLASGAGADPLYTGNHAPFAGLLGFPTLRDAAVLPRGAFRAELHSSLANNHSTSARAGEAVNLDGETLSLVARTAYGLGAGWDVEAEVSWTRHSPGVLDRWIDDWHDVWGLPEGDRPGAPRDLIDFAYRGPEDRFALQDTTAGVGRLHLAVTRALWQGGGHALSARAGAKLGVGKAADLLGGGDDAYVSVHWTRAGRGARSLTWHAQAGLLRAGASPVLPGIAERSPLVRGSRRRVARIAEAPPEAATGYACAVRGFGPEGTGRTVHAPDGRRNLVARKPLGSGVRLHRGHRAAHGAGFHATARRSLPAGPALIAEGRSKPRGRLFW